MNMNQNNLKIKFYLDIFTTQGNEGVPKVNEYTVVQVSLYNQILIVCQHNCF